jgi:hypothetical protein
MLDRREKLYPLPIARALDAAEKTCAGEAAPDVCHEAVLGLASALACYLGAIAVAQYSQALYTDQVSPDPTLDRSLRSLRRILMGQWLLWAARGLAAIPQGSVEGLADWYATKQGGELAAAYQGLRTLMVEHLAYAGDYGPQETVSPRTLPEMVDQYRIRRSKTPAGTLPSDFDARVAERLLPGLRAAVQSGAVLKEYDLYAPQQRQLLMGLKPVTPMPPISAPPEAAAAATLLLYPPGELPDYTKRPDFTKERLPLFPLDPLLTYLPCPHCNRHRILALHELTGGTAAYVGLDPDCGHRIGVREDDGR